MKRSPGPTIPPLGALLKPPAGCYVQRWRGRLVIRRKPRFSKAALTPAQLQNRADFARLAAAANDVLPTDQVIARIVANGSLLVWRDVLALAMTGQLVLVPGVLYPLSYPQLDQVSDVPGSILFRDTDQWYGLAPGADQQVLTIDNGVPVWRDAQSGGGGAPRGMFSGVMSDTPTQVSTGFSSTAGTGNTLANINEGISLRTTGGGIAYTSGVPATPYTATALLTPRPTAGIAALGWYDGTKLHMIYVGTPIIGAANRVNVQKNSAVNTYSGTDYNTALSMPWDKAWLRLGDDGTTVSFQISDNGVDFDTVFSVAKSSGYLGSSGYSKLFFGCPGSAGGATLHSYETA